MTDGLRARLGLGFGIALRQFSLLALVACLSFALSAWQLSERAKRLWPSSRDGETVQLTARIESVSVQAEVSRLQLRVLSGTDAANTPELMDLRVKVTWHQAPPLTVGDHWRLPLRLFRPRSSVNPGGFDYAAWLIAQGIDATGYVAKGPKWRERQEGESALGAWRTFLGGQIATVPLQQAGFLAALLMGDTRAITPSQWDSLQSTGTVHLMAISGMHLALVGGLGFLFGRLLAGLGLLLLPATGPWLMRWLPALTCLAFAGLYGALAQWSIPTQRAFWALLAWQLARAGGWTFRARDLLALGFWLVTATAPQAWWHQGFWLSFAAVALLVWLLAGWRWVGSDSRATRWRRYGLAFLRIQLVMGAILCLPLALLGLPGSWTSPLANLVAVPVVTWVLVPGLVFVWAPLAATAWSQPILLALDAVMSALWAFLAYLAQVDGSLYLSALFERQGLAVPLLLGVFLLAPVGARLLPLALVLVLSIGLEALGFEEDNPDTGLRMTVLDVGQGLSVVVEQGDAVLVYDMGPRFGERFDAGRYQVLPFLRYRGLSPDYLMVSHSDSDHAGGFERVRAAFPGAHVVKGESTSAADSRCEAGQQWRLGQASLDVLWPPARHRLADNSASCVLRIRYAGRELLLPGDIEADTETHLAASGQLNPVDVMVASHHGSRSSSTPVWLAATRPEAPQVVIFSAGYRNRYGHPHPDVVSRYREAGAALWNTAEAGAVTIEVSQSGDIRVIAERKRRPKWWF
jgi:competence protein ComEC